MPPGTIPGGMPLAPVNGLSLYYEARGRGSPLVLVHGFACGLRIWDAQVRAFAARHRVLTYDVRGHGLSDAPADAAAYSQPISVDDLRGLLAHRSEEHTSELQSPVHLVCRLLLEKKKIRLYHD